MGQNTKKAVGFTANVKVDPAPQHNPEVNEFLLQAVVAACKGNIDFKNEVLSSINGLNDQ